MNLLAIDTATEVCMIGLQTDTRSLGASERAGRAQTERILPMIDTLCAQGGVSLREMDALVMGRGPGAFTGLRVTAGVVQGLAFALDVPVVRVSSLLILAQTAFEATGQERIIAAFDARMDEVYWCAAERHGDIMVISGSERLDAPEQVGAGLKGEWFGVGPAWQAYGKRMLAATECRVSGRDDTLMSRGEAAVRLGAEAFAAGQAVQAEEAVPVYLRNEVAWKKSAPRP